MRGHFRSRHKDGGYTIRSAIAENPVTYANFTASCVTAHRSFTLWKWRFSTIFTPVTLTLTRWPSYANMTRIPGDTSIPDERKWTSYVKAFESYRLTDRQTDRRRRDYTTPLRGW